ncbi:kinase-like domain-containing protein [Alternaria rosae]|uniref:kinase-like domain-containing protein n=1 Tax=Alternaria rosae TaxID=1187941 RepID=UPI001E8E8ACB|nr:kinase-like domain-containing protein [Alternaria rosae]KAH6878144.1 kinase-like domain-containing protein [Alternaria rosae]
MGTVDDVHAGSQETQGWDNTSTSLYADETLVEDTASSSRDLINIKDWSKLDRGSHIDFGDEETVPIVQGRFLGRGAMSDVYETTIQGYKIAHKRTLFRRRIGERERKEVEILKRLSHVHIVQLIGTYVQRKHLGILLYPVATCDLHTFFEDVEAWSKVVAADESGSSVTRRDSLDSDVKIRLETLHYDFPEGGGGSWASIVYSKIGCLVSAIAYLHDKQIRHKDLKPSNILLSAGQLWLTDFGSSTDFTLLSQSATDNERGTPRYFAPEVAAWKPSGRAADMFSLGCVLLEILSVHRRGSLQLLRTHRGVDPAFHANTKHKSTWLETDSDDCTRREDYLEYAISRMLSTRPKRRPKAIELLHGIVAYDSYRNEGSTPSVFGHCCKRTLVARNLYHDIVIDAARATERIKELERRLSEAKKYRTGYEPQRDNVLETLHLSHQRELEREQKEQVHLRRAWHGHFAQLQANQEVDFMQCREELENEMRLRHRVETQLLGQQKLRRDLEDEIDKLRARIATFPDSNESENHTPNVELADAAETTLKKNHDGPSGLSDDSIKLYSLHEHDKTTSTADSGTDWFANKWLGNQAEVSDRLPTSHDTTHSESNAQSVVLDSLGLQRELQKNLDQVEAIASLPDEVDHSSTRVMLGKAEKLRRRPVPKIRVTYNISNASMEINPNQSNEIGAEDASSGSQTPREQSLRVPERRRVRKSTRGASGAVQSGQINRT